MIRLPVRELFGGEGSCPFGRARALGVSIGGRGYPDVIFAVAVHCKKIEIAFRCESKSYYGDCVMDVPNPVSGCPAFS